MHSQIHCFPYILVNYPDNLRKAHILYLIAFISQEINIDDYRATLNT